MILAWLQQPPIWSGNHLSSSLLVCRIPLFLYDYSHLLLISTALLICMENTFWNISTDVNFADLFKMSLTLYVESGMKKKMEANIDILGNEQGGYLVTEDFKAKFFNIIVEHYLREFHMFIFFWAWHILGTSNHFFCLNQHILRVKLLTWNKNIRHFLRLNQHILRIKILNWKETKKQSLLGYKGWC